MGYKNLYSAEDITNVVRTINAIKYDVCDMKSDGWTQWDAKQDLWQLKWILDQALKNCPTFAPEEEWLREQEKKKIIKILSDDI